MISWSNVGASQLLHDAVLQKFLEADLRLVAAADCPLGSILQSLEKSHASLPASTPYIISTPLILQIDEIVNVGSSVRSQEEGKEKDEGVLRERAGSSRFLKLHLTDGNSDVSLG